MIETKLVVGLELLHGWFLWNDGNDEVMTINGGISYAVCGIHNENAMLEYYAFTVIARWIRKCRSW